ncbi:MAG: DUF362 domain-containing protein [Candidatus Humimicrobiaceae bacterium]
MGLVVYMLKRLEKKLIIKNTFFIRNGRPRLPEISENKKFTFIGDNALAEMLESGSIIFKDFNDKTSVLIKINLNSPNSYPASTSFDMLDALLQSLISRGVKKICIGDCSGLIYLPTRTVIKEKNFNCFKKYNAKIKVFDYGKWVRVPINGVFFKEIILTDTLYKYDKIINLANLKSHRLAGFSFSTKLMVGFMHPYQRIKLHKDHLEERIAEISLAIQPDISIIDGRRIFIDGGPDFGTVAEAKTIIVNNNLLDTELRAYDLLVSYKQQNGICDLDKNPQNNKFFKHFNKIKDN